MQIEVIQPGLLSTFQDNGRAGYRNFAVPESGALDQKSYLGLTKLFGIESIPAIEVFGKKAVFRLLGDCWFAVSGAAQSNLLNEIKIESGKLCRAKKGEVLQLRVDNAGWISYLGIAGMVQCEEIMGSHSTYLPSAIGGYHGRALKKGDIIDYRPIETSQNRSLSFPNPRFTFSNTIRFEAGPEYEWLLPDSRNEFILNPYKVSTVSNRMGYRMDGLSLKVKSHNMKSQVVFPGTIQVPPSGLPIVLMRDGQTTGGYPRIGYLKNEDLDRLAQCAPGCTVRFKRESI